ncbi:c-type cytochrome [Phenylobacterium sp. LjRoot225]|uniref:c-type cytochrome n=1 Tax=Phenylobacterium sp. LjRoot225 TaxID=3342285 RepID=UPI003ECE5DB2
MSPRVRLFALTIVLLGAAAPAMAQDATAGGLLFKQRCQACHTVTPGQPSTIAPGLIGVVGRKAGATAFSYSPALKASGLTWDKATLDKFLAAPNKLVPGTRMLVMVSDPKQRADLVAYMASLKK